MRIIFDSDMQKDFVEKLLFDEFCPSCLNLKETCGPERDCKKCWKNCGLEMEVL